MYLRKPNIQHNCKLDDLRAGFKIAEEYRIRYALEVNFQSPIGQGGLFGQSHSDRSSAYALTVSWL